MSEDVTSSDGTEQEWNGYSAEYCENCGQLFSASDKIVENVTEPVHRVELIEAVGEFEEVGETVALELRECECTGQVVKRHYVYPASNVPEPDYEPDPGEFSGRDPDEDALIGMSDDPEPDDFQEAREVSWIETEGETADQSSTETDRSDDVRTDGGHLSAAGGPAAPPERVGRDGRAFLSTEGPHLCDVCRRTFATLNELADHNCRAPGGVYLDGGGRPMTDARDVVDDYLDEHGDRAAPLDSGSWIQADDVVDVTEVR